jgi:hypothetical protein
MVGSIVIALVEIQFRFRVPVGHRVSTWSQPGPGYKLGMLSAGARWRIVYGTGGLRLRTLPLQRGGDALHRQPEESRGWVQTPPKMVNKPDSPVTCEVQQLLGEGSSVASLWATMEIRHSIHRWRGWTNKSAVPVSQITVAMSEYPFEDGGERVPPSGNDSGSHPSRSKISTGIDSCIRCPAHAETLG